MSDIAGKLEKARTQFNIEEGLNETIATCNLVWEPPNESNVADFMRGSDGLHECRGRLLHSQLQSIYSILVEGLLTCVPN